MSKGPGKAARAKALRMGEALITRYSHGNTMPGREAAMWALLCHATQVSRLAFQAPPRTGYPVASPGAILAVDDVSDWQRVAAYLRGELDSVDSASARPAQPSAEEISAAEVVLTVFHRAALRGYGDWRRLRGAVYVLSLIHI